MEVTKDRLRCIEESKSITENLKQQKSLSFDGKNTV